MEVSVDVHKIIKCAIYSIIFFPSGGGVHDVSVRLSLIKKNYQWCQFDVHCIQYQTSTHILRIMNEFVQYVQNYFGYVYIPI